MTKTMFYVYLRKDFTIFIHTKKLTNCKLLGCSTCEITASDLAHYYFNKYN